MATPSVDVLPKVSTRSSVLYTYRDLVSEKIAAVGPTTESDSTTHSACKRSYYHSETAGRLVTSSFTSVPPAHLGTEARQTARICIPFTYILAWARDGASTNHMTWPAAQIYSTRPAIMSEGVRRYLDRSNVGSLAHARRPAVRHSPLDRVQCSQHEYHRRSLLSSGRHRGLASPNAQRRHNHERVQRRSARNARRLTQRSCV